MIVKLLTEHHLESLSLKGGCRGSSESTHVKCHIVGNLMSRLISTYLSSHTGYGECLTFDSFLGDISIDLWAQDELR